MSISLDFSSNESPMVCYFEQDYPEVTSWEGCFRILVDCDVFFEEPGFPILEFVRALEKWDGTKNFDYCCIDADANPLILFKEKNGYCEIYSPWQKFSCSRTFMTQELLTAKDKLFEVVQSYFPLEY